ncbi:hypothetical protein K438DRAFT_1977069 [Mycena galopus ATCC 62051]|nr:hypothetical protein K438DRAFT_1977069 [Mycena galopus ATCC 62051]
MGCARTRERDVDGDTRHPPDEVFFVTRRTDRISFPRPHLGIGPPPRLPKPSSARTRRLASSRLLLPLELSPSHAPAALIATPASAPLHIPLPTLFWFSMPDTVTLPPPLAAFAPAVSISPQSCCASSVCTHAFSFSGWRTFAESETRNACGASRRKQDTAPWTWKAGPGGRMEGGRTEEDGGGRRREEGGGRREGGRGIRRR